MPPASRVAPLALLGLALVIALARLHTWDEPLERDITGMAVIGQALRDGDALYSGIWDHKPPAAAVTHAAAITAVGFGRRAIYLLGVVTAVVVLVGVYTAGAAAGGSAAGLWAAAFWTVLAGDLWLQANQPNVEAFLNACLVWVFALLLRPDGPTPWWRFAGAGTAVALASLFKTVAVASIAPLALLLVVWPAGGQRRRALAGVGLMLAIGALTWGLVVGYFAATGRLAAFVEAVFTYNRFYAGSLWTNLGRGAHPTFLFHPTLVSLLPVAALAAMGAARGLMTGPRRRWVLLGALAVGTMVAVALPGRFYPHYYQLWIPVLTIGAGWAAAELGRVGPRVLGPLAGAAALLFLVVFQLPLYELPPDDWSRAKYRSDIFVAERDLARELRTLLLPGETFYEFGAETGLYFETGQRPLSGAFYAYPLLSGPVAGALTARAIADLERRPPELFVVVDWVLGATTHPLRQWTQTRYRPAPGEPRRGPFLLLVRRGSALEARLEAAPRAGARR
jgi:hypothetical protein